MGELNERLEKIEQLLQPKDKEKEKGFKIPFFKRVRPKQARKGYVTVFQINENGFINAKKEIILEQTVMIDGVPRLATPEYILHFKKNPILILPTYSVKPLSPNDLFKPFDITKSQEQSLKDGSNVVGYKILMARMKSETVNPKKSMGGMFKWVIGLAVAAIIGYALLTGGS